MKDSAIIYRFRKSNDLTQKQLAKELGVYPSQISRWESGESRVPVAVIKLLKEWEIKKVAKSEQTHS